MKQPKITCRYLPAKGEIKSRQMIGESVAMEMVKRTIFPKRFAVTTEFKIGDEIIDQDGKTFVLTKEKEVELADAIKKLPNDIEGKRNWVKKLAPLSPNVTWDIKDGAEIEAKRDGLLGETFIVKGPCGHYH